MTAPLGAITTAALAGPGPPVWHVADAVGQVQQCELIAEHVAASQAQLHAAPPQSPHQL